MHQLVSKFNFHWKEEHFERNADQYVWAKEELDAEDLASLGVMSSYVEGLPQVQRMGKEGKAFVGEDGVMFLNLCSSM